MAGREQRLRVLICDVDGTLVDSAEGVVQAVKAACAAVGVPMPSAALVRAQIGLSLDVMFARLDIRGYARHRDALLSAYRDAYYRARAEHGARDHSPLFPGVMDLLRRLAAEPWTLLALATGKSRRGVDALVAAHGLDGLFASIQTADRHPSKPDPAMIHAVLRETGADPGDAVMLGDTIYDVEMARRAGVASIGVGWGYHPLTDLRADRAVGRFDEVEAAFDALTRDGVRS